MKILQCSEQKADAQTGVNTDVNVDGKSAIEKTESATEKTKTKVDAKKAAAVEKTKSTKSKADAKVKTEARSKSQAALHASDEAKENANENSAIFGAKSETDASQNVNADKNGVSGNGQIKSKTTAKGQVKKG